MESFSGKASSFKTFMLCSCAMAAISLILGFCARKFPGFADWYSLHIYGLIEKILGSISGVLPFSLSEAGLYLLILYSLYYVVHHLSCPLVLISRAIFLASFLFLVFMLNCGINYYRSPFSYEAGFTIEKASPQQLYRLCELLTKQVNKAAENVDDYMFDRDFLKEMGVTGQKSMENLGNSYPQLGGSYPYPKPLMSSWILSVQQLAGIYSPFTVEAIYNAKMPRYNIPHTICHELSHLKSYMREDEANFIGYLACIQSESEYFRYSGYLTGWVYAGNALAKVDYEGYVTLYKSLNARALADLEENNQFWAKYEGAVAEAATKMNDTYLKANRQSDGVQSYGRMVDLMLAYYGM